MEWARLGCSDVIERVSERTKANKRIELPHTHRCACCRGPSGPLQAYLLSHLSPVQAPSSALPIIPLPGPPPPPAALPPSSPVMPPTPMSSTPPTPSTAFPPATPSAGASTAPPAAASLPLPAPSTLLIALHAGTLPAPLPSRSPLAHLLPTLRTPLASALVGASARLAPSLPALRPTATPLGPTACSGGGTGAAAGAVGVVPVLVDDLHLAPAGAAGERPVSEWLRQAIEERGLCEESGAFAWRPLEGVCSMSGRWSRRD